jgi:hypothetical protein
MRVYVVFKGWYRMNGKISKREVGRECVYKERGGNEESDYAVKQNEETGQPD